MSDRAQRPLNQDAVTAADDDVYQKHADDPRPNALYDADGNRKPLDPNDPDQAGLRQEWMDSYKANGGQMEPSDESGGAPDQAVLPCGQQAQVDPLIIGDPVDLDDSDDGFDDTPDTSMTDDDAGSDDSPPDEDETDSPNADAGAADPDPLPPDGGGGTPGLPSKAARIAASGSSDPASQDSPPQDSGDPTSPADAAGDSDGSADPSE